MIIKKCLFCEKEFKVYPTLVRRGYAKYCSRICRNKGRLIEFPYIRENCKKRAKKYLGLKGEQSPGWKGGISTENEKQRKSLAFKLWRQKIFERDNYKCRDCNKNSNDLHPHHIIPFHANKKLRFDIKNGITLCGICHRQKHKKDAKIWGSWAKRYKDANHFQYTQ